MVKDRETWRSAVHEVIKSWTWLSDWTGLPAVQKSPGWSLGQKDHRIKHNSKILGWAFFSVDISSVQSLSHVLLFATPWTAALHAVHHQLPDIIQTHVHESVMPSNHLILCRPLLLLPLIFSSIRVFSSKSVLRIWWPKYWSFSFSLSPSNEYSGLISF